MYEGVPHYNILSAHALSMTPEVTWGLITSGGVRLMGLLPGLAVDQSDCSLLRASGLEFILSSAERKWVSSRAIDDAF